jgi:hypothetical protein
MPCQQLLAPSRKVNKPPFRRLERGPVVFVASSYQRSVLEEYAAGTQ